MFKSCHTGNHGKNTNDQRQVGMNLQFSFFNDHNVAKGLEGNHHRKGVIPLDSQEFPWSIDLEELGT